VTDDLTYYNDDPRYELMAELIKAQLNIPDDRDILEGMLLDILQECHFQTLPTHNGKYDADDLAGSIVAILQGYFGTDIPRTFENEAKKRFDPREIRRPKTVDPALIELDD